MHSKKPPASLQFKTLENTSLEQLVEAFNAAFSRYFVPVQMTGEQLAFKMKVDSTSLRYSVGAFEGEQLVGFILHGIAKHLGKVTAYNAGTGVLENYRGQQLTQKMYAFALPLLREAGITYTLLEVITENKRAQKPYTKVGFERLRTVNSYQLKNTQDFPKPTSSWKPFENDQGILLSDYEQENPPTWQNARHSLLQYDDTAIQYLVVNEEDKIVGYLLLNKNSNRLLHLFVEPAFRQQGVASALLYKACQNFPSLSVLNLDEKQTQSIQFLEKRGFEATFQQYEMGRPL